MNFFSNGYFLKFQIARQNGKVCFSILMITEKIRFADKFSKSRVKSVRNKRIKKINNLFQNLFFSRTFLINNNKYFQINYWLNQKKVDEFVYRSNPKDNSDLIWKLQLSSAA